MWHDCSCVAGDLRGVYYFLSFEFEEQIAVLSDVAWFFPDSSPVGAKV